ncbi:hypothetical protein [Paraburkholderia panacisoli]|uniref:hypothetical protein n=1 Tax=Paraburkholderia panacisoli TaxID=2603818 RepID=UPI00165F9881|nr:hypothetical protein [Paraburkholderia panacisoli]
MLRLRYCSSQIHPEDRIAVNQHRQFFHGTRTGRNEAELVRSCGDLQPVSREMRFVAWKPFAESLSLRERVLRSVCHALSFLRLPAMKKRAPRRLDHQV